MDDHAGRVDHPVGTGEALEGVETVGDLAAQRLRGAGVGTATGQSFAFLVHDRAGHREHRGRIAGSGERARDDEDALDARRVWRAHHTIIAGPSRARWRERMGVEPTARRRAPRHRC